MFRQLIAGAAAAVIALTGVKSGQYSSDEFCHAEGSTIVSPAGETAVLRGMGFGNDMWVSSLADIGLHHNEDSFREMSELGFNSVRFLLNYRWLEDDENPYVYKQEGFDYIDRSIAWAKKYNIGLVLNMHYPQGGYQSQGNGTALWTDPENQRRLVKLWGEIARRYADEPAIQGYGLINEPVVPELGSAAETVGQCQRLMQRCTDEIRRYDRNHIVFVERVVGVKDMSTGENLWNKYPIDDLWFLIDDDNAVYETHFYTPAVFTHQSAGDSVEYPKPCYVDNYLEYWVGCMSARQTSQDTYYESDFFTAEEDYNIYAPVLHSSKLGSGTALFDDVTVTEYAPDGTSGVVWHNDFSDGSQKPENAWSSDGTGSWSMSEGYLKISGGTDDYVLTFDKLKLREGCKYKISGHMQTVGAPSGGFADIRADFSLAENVYESGREYVFAELSEIVRFGKENNVPIYFGEFGADAESFKNGLGGERWVADVMDFFNENGISYSYHAYHEPMFGFYPEDTVKYPQHRNEALAKVFADKNRNG